MPIFDVECPKGHKHEILLSTSEHRAATQSSGRVQVDCPEEGCAERADQQVSTFGATPVQWRRAAHGQST